jgi:hypothetical protein
VAVAADLFLVHVGEQKILRLDMGVRHARIDVAEIVGEGADIVVVILGPSGEVLAGQLARGPGDAERRFVGALALDRVFQGIAKRGVAHQVGHDDLLLMGTSLEPTSHSSVKTIDRILWILDTIWVPLPGASGAGRP